MENAVSQISYFFILIYVFWDIVQTGDNNEWFRITVVLSALPLVSLLGILKFWECSDILGDCFIRELENEM